MAALLGGMLGKRCRIPGGTLLGSSIVVALVANLTDLSQDGINEFMFIMQILIGCMLGQSINRRFWSDILTIWRPTLLYIGVFTLVALPFAAGLVIFCDFDGLTAILASTPARTQDMIIMAQTADRDTVTVMLQQMVRQFCIIGITPFILARLSRKEKAAASMSGPPGPHGPLSPTEKQSATAQASAKQLSSGAATGTWQRTTSRFPRIDFVSLVILLSPAVLGAFAGKLSPHPVGPMLGAFIGVCITRISFIRAGEIPFPRSLSFLVQCCAGFLLGIRVTPEIGDLILLRAMPLALSLVYILGTSLVLARVLQRYYKWSPALSWMAAAPGRTSDMLAISYDLSMTGHERLALVSVHTIRQIYFTIFTSTVLLFF